MILCRSRILVRTSLFIISLCMLWLQLHIIQLRTDNGNATNPVMVVPLPIAPNEPEPPDEPPPPVAIPFLPTVNETEVLRMNLTAIKQEIDAINSAQYIYNLYKFPNLDSEMPVVVVQVHTRVSYLIQLIDSLRHAQDIEKVLLIFSHDVYDPQINAVVQAVDFCKVIQIFYPQSIQLHPHEFPGPHAKDCPRDIKKPEAMKRKCNNAEHPDVYGHYREARFTQTKHHWWWKNNRVFTGLDVTRNLTGPFIFLEEDHFVSPDFLHILTLLRIAQQTACTQCNILCLGTYLKSYNFAADSKRTEIWQWVSSRHNMGMVLTKNVWNSITSCGEQFCKFDDYNWDWSLQHISTTCMKNKLTTLVVKAPRVFHIGECGVHHKKRDCNALSVIDKVRRTLDKAKPYLFPLQLSVTTVVKRPGKQPKSNGGWGDHRDHQLCLANYNTTNYVV